MAYGSAYWRQGARYWPTVPGYGHLRASDADRDRAIEVLKAGFAEGRLTKDEYGERQEKALTARTYRDLAPLLADLPWGAGALGLPGAIGPPGPPGTPGPPGASGGLGGWSGGFGPHNGYGRSGGFRGWSGGWFGPPGGFDRSRGFDRSGAAGPSGLLDPARPLWPGPRPANFQAGRRINPLAAASVISAFVPFFGSVAAIVLGHAALREIRETGEAGSAMAAVGIALGYIVVALFTLLALVALVASAHSPGAVPGPPG